MLTYPNLVPGAQAIRESVERDMLWGEVHDYVLDSVVIVSTTVDARSTVTTDLQPGLCLGKVSSSGKFRDYAATNTDGSQHLQLCILAHPLQMLDGTNTARDQLALVIVRGPVRNGQLGGLDQQFRANTHGIFLYDDDYMGNSIGWRDTLVKIADYTVVAADNNRVFNTRGSAGAVNFTLPTLAKGLRYRFFNEADQNMTVTSAVADTMVTVNDLAADSVAFSTAGDKIGGCVEVMANDNASKWLVFKLCSNAMTIST